MMNINVIVFIFYAEMMMVIAQMCPGGLPTAEVQAFLQVHNTLRSKLSSGQFVAKGRKMPAAKIPIVPLKWDCTLEKEAQQFAKQCKIDNSGIFDQGENIYTYTAPKTKKITKAGWGVKASNSWASEFQTKGWSSVVFTDKQVSTIGEATQMVWSKTTKLGCGIALCQKEKQAFVVCRYNEPSHLLQRFHHDSTRKKTDNSNVTLHQNLSTDTPKRVGLMLAKPPQGEGFFGSRERRVNYCL